MKHAYLADCNKAFVTMYGYDNPDDLIGARFPQLFIRTDPSNIRSLRTFIKDGYRVENAETHEVGKNGGHRYFINDAYGVVEGNFLVIAFGRQRDITADISRRETLNQLTLQERKVLKHTVDGKTLKEIGDKISVNPKTVDSLRTRIKRKLGVATIPELIVLAIELGLQNIDI